MYRRFGNTFGRIYGDGENTETNTENKEASKTFTQDDVNRFLAEDRRKHQTQLSTLQKELEQFKGTAKEKEALQQKLEDMQKQFLTKEELAKQEQEKVKSKYDQDLKTAATERDQWKQLFVNTTTENQIQSAAIANKAFNPEQIKLLLKSQVQLKQKTDDQGNPLMQFDVVMPMTIKDKDGSEKVLELSVMEGIKKMREMPEFANLFLVEGNAGTGTTTINNGVSTPTADKPPSDPAAYRAWRVAKKNAGQL